MDDHIQILIQKLGPEQRRVGVRLKESNCFFLLIRKIEKHCINLIAGQQPLAKDLRTISSALKIITDMERIGDHSSDISGLIMKMTYDRNTKVLSDISLMADLAKQMVNKSIDAYVKEDIELAKQVCVSDDEVDELFRKIILEVEGVIKNDLMPVEQSINFIFISKYLERMADHATNIGEWVIYNVTGEHKHMN